MVAGVVPCSCHALPFVVVVVLTSITLACRYDSRCIIHGFLSTPVVEVVESRHGSATGRGRGDQGATWGMVYPPFVDVVDVVEVVESRHGTREGPPRRAGLTTRRHCLDVRPQSGFQRSIGSGIGRIISRFGIVPSEIVDD